jgi:hypothetical protein
MSKNIHYIDRHCAKVFFGDVELVACCDSCFTLPKQKFSVDVEKLVISFTMTGYGFFDFDKFLDDTIDNLIEANTKESLRHAMILKWQRLAGLQRQ